MHLLWHLLRLVKLLLVQILSLPLLGGAGTWCKLLLRDVLCVASAHGFSQGRRHLTRRKSSIISCCLIFVSELILMTRYLLTLAQRWVLVLRLRCVAHHTSWRVLRYPLMRRVRDVRQVATWLSLSLVIGGCIGAPLGILRVMRLWLNDESGHVILDILLHQQVVLAVVVDKLVLVVALHDFIHSVIVVEVQRASLLLRHVVGIVVDRQLFSMLFEEELELLVYLVLRQSFEAFAAGGALPALTLFL